MVVRGPDESELKMDESNLLRRKTISGKNLFPALRQNCCMLLHNPQMN
jgi:hypothetical protein